MPTSITTYDVREVYNTELSDTVIAMYIGVLSSADPCLDALGLESIQIKVLKSLTVAHLIVINESGQVRSESDMDGASVTYDIKNVGEGFSETSYGRLVQGMPGYECIQALFDKPRRFAGAIG
jgi:hypothetical protein